MRAIIDLKVPFVPPKCHVPNAPSRERRGSARRTQNRSVIAGRYHGDGEVQALRYTGGLVGEEIPEAIEETMDCDACQKDCHEAVETSQSPYVTSDSSI